MAIVKELAGEEATSTTEPATTQPATTEPPTTEPPTTEPEGPALLPSGPLAASPMAFATAWNHSVAGTDVPALTEGPTPPPNWTQESIAGVTAYRANLGGNVWLVALAAAPADPVVQALLVWEPNVGSADVAAQNQLYRDAFQALTKTVNESATEAERLKLNAQLGLTRKHPPYPDDTQETARLAPHQYELFNANPAEPTEPGPATVISVITSTAG